MKKIDLKKFKEVILALFFFSHYKKCLILPNNKACSHPSSHLPEDERWHAWYEAEQNILVDLKLFC